MERYDAPLGANIEFVWKTMALLKEYDGNDYACSFNGSEITTEMTLDECYAAVTGKTKAEFDAAVLEEMDSMRRFMEEEDRKVPGRMEANLERAKGLVRDEDLEEYGKVADVRFHDIYRGMEMDAMLDIAEAYRDGGVSAAKEAFDGQNHSGMSASITAGLVARFVDEGLGKYLYEA